MALFCIVAILSSMKLLPDILVQRANELPDQRAYTFLADGEKEEIVLTYQDLLRQAQTIAGQLQQSFKPGDRVLLLFPPGTEFVSAFWGCLLAGMVAVPVHPPWDKRTQKRFLALCKDAAPQAALSTQDIIKKTRLGRIFVGSLRQMQWIAVDKLRPELAMAWKLPNISSETLAFIQYTSGSTGTAKGVLLTHGNLFYNTRLLQSPIKAGIEEKGFVPESMVCWLPVYHDMGLMTSVIFPIVLGAPCTAMSPLMFLQQPVRWLKAMTTYQATISVAPNFGYELCMKRIKSAQIAQLDLSHWSAALNGAEYLRIETLKRFAETFAPCGFRYEAFYPCYGLAESTVFVTGGTRYQEPETIILDKEQLKNNQIKQVPSEHPSAFTLISVGQSWLEQKLYIVDPQTHHLKSDLEVGEVWLNSASVSQGYWQRPEANNNSFGWTIEGMTEADKFLRTGDLGFLFQGQLYITGRIKDLVIIRGRNHYPQHIEQTVTDTHYSLRKGCGAAFSILKEGQERLVIVQEIKKSAVDVDIEDLTIKIREAISQEHGIPIYDLVFIQHGTLLKTSSGKIQRSRCKRDYESGKLMLWKEDK